MSNGRFRSERDFVSNYILERFKEARDNLGLKETIDFHIDTPVNGGIADFYIERGGKRLLVLEAKFKKKVGKREVDIEPRDPEVIQQAVKYAVMGGFKFYATCNSKRLILYKLIPGKKSHECEIINFEFQKSESWNLVCLRYALELIELKLKPLDDTLVDTLLEAYEDLYPEFLYSLKNKLKNFVFKKKYADWLSNQGLEFNDERNNLIASQSTYLQINKLLFYKVIRQIYPTKLPKLKISGDDDVEEKLLKFYEKVKKIDYEPIYQSDVISEIPLTDRAKERFITLIDTLLEFDFTTIESDFLGRIYEKLIPAEERKRLGQFYTPPAVVDLIVNLVVKKKDDVVLDPACGSGTFLVKTYHKLRKLNKIPPKPNGGLYEVFHNQLLQKIYGVDINQFPSHLSVINLAIQSPKSKIDATSVMVNDFFDVKGGFKTLAGFQSLDTEGKPKEIMIPTSFDVIVANPPYVRQELLGESEKKKIKKCLKVDFNSKVLVGKSSKEKRIITLNKNSDIYIYFYIHAVSLLKKHGLLGFVSSNKWLEVSYGKPFQEFLLKYTKIKYIIEFDSAVFSDLEVDTCVIILEKESDNELKESNPVRFVRVKRKISMDKLSVLLETTTNIDNDEIKINVIDQGRLKPGKWIPHLRAPPIFKKIITNPLMKRLNDFSDVYRGLLTGCEQYFILSKDDVKEWKIESEFLKPCVPPGEKIKGVVLEKSEVNQFFFDVQKYLPELRGTNALKYIQYGESLKADPKARRKKSIPIPEIQTLKSRKNWYSIPKMEKPSIIYPMWFRYKFRTYLNETGAYGNNFYYHIRIEKKYEKCLAAILNSTLIQFLLELYGRQYSGVLHLMVYELQDLPVLNPKLLTTDQVKKLTMLFDQLNIVIKNRMDNEEKLKRMKSKKTQQKGLFEKEAEKELDTSVIEEANVRKKLDKVIFDILEFNNKDINETVKGLIHLRDLRKKRTRT